MLIENACLDWLTLSEPLTGTDGHILGDLVQQLGRKGKDSRRLGYQGNTYDFQSVASHSDKGSLFYGERTWKGQGWGLLIASGESAHWLLEHLWQTDTNEWASIRCTRLDVQVTIPWPEGMFYLRCLELTQDVTASVIHGLSEGNQWSETLYLGSRSSPVLVRAYRKRVDDSGHDWLRVEVEYKREASKGLFWHLLGDRAVGNWFGPVLERCEQLYYLIDDYLDEDPDRPDVYRVVGKTMLWLKTTVASCVCRLLEDDDLSEETCALVRQWYDYSQYCQNRRTVVQ